ncbi:MAG: primosomal protein N', partial [Burkholderiaceae bacterium]|nr:primosomal protein N' [Burkholderiaceae bacterium]
LRLSPAQQVAVDALCAADRFVVHLLHGVTGSGKTEVYLRWLAQVLARTRDAQVLLLVPEIALTPQLVAQVSARLPDESIALLHSELPDGERAAHWLAAAQGRARVVVGTRLSVLTPLPRLAAVVVDEEHDPSYKQHEGVRYSARDLAIALASQRGVPIVLGSATPSLETWFAARRGRYRLLALPERAGEGRVPVLRIVDPRRKTLSQGLAPESVAAIAAVLARGEQSLVFLNRRGYAPVLSCEACGWLSACENCSAFRVLHRASGADAARKPSRYRLLCHHCSADAAVPRACPGCGNVDLAPLGRGTQRLEEGLAELFPAARIGRVDRDVARRRHAVREAIDAAHAGELDLLVGTQMIAKGHDFQRLALVVVVDVDSGLYSADFRAPERLFALLMQVAGRAGRSGLHSEVIVQTRFPDHPMFAALARHDFDRQADMMLAERRDARLPPFRHQALLRAEGKTLDKAVAFLGSAREHAAALIAADQSLDAVQLFDPVPALMSRVAGRERAQLLIESDSRPALHALLDAWLAELAARRSPVRWQLDVDPLEI